MTKNNKTPPYLTSFLNEVRSGDLGDKIQNKEIEVKALGIQLNPSEDRLLNALKLLLHEKSQNIKPNDADFHMGNEMKSLGPFGGEKKESPTISIKPSELYRAFLGKTNYSSHEIKHVRETLSCLEEKKFLMTYKRRRHEIRKGAKVDVFDVIEEWQSLVKVVAPIDCVWEEGALGGEVGNSNNKKTRGVLIGLNPQLAGWVKSEDLTEITVGKT